MITTIYLDALFLLNAVMDYFLLLATGKLTDAVIRQSRLILAAVSGGLYGVAAALYREFWGAAIMIQLAASVLLVLLAYDFSAFRRFLRIWAVFLGVSFAFGGCILAISLMNGDGIFTVRLPTVIAAALLCYATVALILRKIARVRQTDCEILVEQDGRECRLRAFLDTGQRVKDPVSNAQVIIVELKALKPLFTEAEYKAIGKAKPETYPYLLAELSAAHRFRLIPYRTVGSCGELLLAFRPERVLVNGRKAAHALLAISPTPLADHGEFDALVGIGEERL